MAIASFLAASPATASGDLCRDSTALLEEKFEASGMLITRNTLSTIIRDSRADAEQRYLSLLVLSCTDDESVAPVLIEALNDSDKQIRAGAAISLRQLRSREAVLPLIAVVRDQSEDENIRRIASATLSLIAPDNPDLATAIAAAARDKSQNTNVRVNHVLALGRITSDLPIALIRDLLEDDDPNVMTATAVALAQHGEMEVVPHLVNAVLSPYPQFWLKSDAARELGNLVGRDFLFVSKNSEIYRGDPSGNNKLQSALVEIDNWWRENRDKYE